MSKILLVEDDKSLREIYGVRLLAEGYDIVSAGDGEEALAMAIKERPQLIISDVMMPKISGFDMLDILRSTTETKNIRVIMMTALSSEDQRKRGEQLGADKYLVKSQVGIEDVVRAVHEILEDSGVPSAPAATAAPAPSAAPATAPATPAPVPAPATPPVGGAHPMGGPQPSIPPTPTPAPATSPLPSPTVSGPAPSHAASDDSSLPQPTAPFSTNRPGSSAGKVIEPLSSPEPKDEPPIADLMDKELGSSDNPFGSGPAAPTPPPVGGPRP